MNFIIYLFLSLCYLAFKLKIEGFPIYLNGFLGFGIEWMLLFPLVLFIIQLKLDRLMTYLASNRLIKAIATQLHLLMAIAFAVLLQIQVSEQLQSYLMPKFKDQSLIPLILTPVGLLTILSFSLILLWGFSYFFNLKRLLVRPILRFSVQILLFILPIFIISYPAWQIFFSLYPIDHALYFLLFLGILKTVAIVISVFFKSADLRISFKIYLLIQIFLMIIIYLLLSDSAIRQFAKKESLLTRTCLKTIEKFFDRDQDGFSSLFAQDCNDQEASIHPMAIDLPSTSIHENCDPTPLQAFQDLAPIHLHKLQQIIDQQPADQALALPNILLISVDTLRADHMQIYGYPNPTTPFLNQIKDRFISFDQAYATSNATKYSLSSMLTGLPYRMIPFEIAGIKAKFSAQTPTIFKALQSLGYHTQAHLPNFFVHGFIKDISSHFDRIQGYGANSEIKTLNSNEMLKGTLKSIADLQTQTQTQPKPWSLWLHLADPHEPYVCDPALKTKMSCYDQEILKTDLLLSKLLSPNLLSNTIVIITSDHGEEFEEHGLRYHHYQLYQESIHVPLLIAMPNLYQSSIQAPKINFPFSLVNLFPLIIDLIMPQNQTNLLNTESDKAEYYVTDLKHFFDKVEKTTQKITRVNQSEKIENIEENQKLRSKIEQDINRFNHYDIFSEHFEAFNEPRNRKLSLINGDLKMIFDIKNQELFFFNLKKDPQEKQDLSNQNEKNILQFKGKMQNYLQRETETQILRLKSASVIKHDSKKAEQILSSLSPKPIQISEDLLLWGSKLTQLENEQDEPGSSQFFLKLYWQVQKSDLPDIWVELEWRNQSNNRTLSNPKKTRPLSGLYPTNLWEKDDLIEDTYYFKTKSTRQLEHVKDLAVRLKIFANTKNKNAKEETFDLPIFF
jgi:arylsulfatase A-like enzyme